MKTVILCGGQGTRIRDVAADIPKPMIAIGRYPILWHIMKGYAHWGHKDFVLCLGHQGQVIKEFFVNYQLRTADVTIDLGHKLDVETHSRVAGEDWRVTLAETGLDAMTGARVRHIRDYVKDNDTFMLTYGDGVGNVDIKALIAFHKKHGKTMTVTGVRPPGRFGEIELDGDRVKGFNEKPQATEGRISGGFFVCDRRLFDYLDERESLMLEAEPMQKLVKAGELMAFRHDGFWHPMDTSRDYKLLNDLWAKGEAPWKVW
jgi:glucose-1-phosphate cytidylyltransferase